MLPNQYAELGLVERSASWLFVLHVHRPRPYVHGELRYSSPPHVCTTVVRKPLPPVAHAAISSGKRGLSMKPVTSASAWPLRLPCRSSSPSGPACDYRADC